MKIVDTLLIVSLLIGLPRMGLVTRRKVAGPMLLATFIAIAVSMIAIIRLRPWRFIG